MKVHVRECDDWIAVYIDGKMIIQGHTIHFVRGMRLLIDLLDLPIDMTDEYDEDAEFPNELE